MHRNSERIEMQSENNQMRFILGKKSRPRQVKGNDPKKSMQWEGRIWEEAMLKITDVTIDSTLNMSVLDRSSSAQLSEIKVHFIKTKIKLPL